jgi:hypothetical protein
MLLRRHCFSLLILLMIAMGGKADSRGKPPIYISFLWHMHQPIYWPYESVLETDQHGRYPYSVVDIFNQRTGPYTVWPGNAVQKGISAGLAHFGAQVSFSGSLIENLNTLEQGGNQNFLNWKSTWKAVTAETTALGNPRLDLVGFGYHHPLMGLIGTDDIRRQIEAHRQSLTANFSSPISRGIFPPENAFSPREIPALVAEGLQWVLVDNIHFDRACSGYPYSGAGNLFEPNASDIRNPNPADWIQLTGLWAPTQTSARWGRQPHYVRSVDPATGVVSKIIAVPADRYMGNEDGRGGFGALNYENVMSQLEPFNTDSTHPILIVLHHDGDNYGGGSDAYYNNNFQSFVNWLVANPSRFVCTTIQDYLDRFPPDSADVIHVEDGSWSGADNGDPEFLKWNGDPVSGYSPDRNSWGVVTAAKNIVQTADQINPTDPAVALAWKYFLNAEASDYWYWDGSQNGLWDAHPARACNQAIASAMPLVHAGADHTPPTVYLPQREPYNPGGTEWGIGQSKTFTVWSYVYDVSGLASVALKLRTGSAPAVSDADELYAGGVWTSIPMNGVWIAPQTNPAPAVKAYEYSAQVSGFSDVLLDYFVEAVDSVGNIARSPIRHVRVGASGGGPGGGPVTWTPASPAVGDSICVTVHGAGQGAALHWGVNNNGGAWEEPNPIYWPTGSLLFGGTGPALETPMHGPDSSGNLTVTLPPFTNPAQPVQRVAFVIHYNNNSWDNNGGSDYHIAISGAQPVTHFIIDGLLDSSAVLTASTNGINLYTAWNGSDLYVATQNAQAAGGDIFIFIADSLGAPVVAPWSKSGTVSAWSAFLGNESDNNWSGWFGRTQNGLAANVAAASGSFLEGTINLQGYFGKIPTSLFLALGKYQTANDGTLIAQLPAGNSDSNIDKSEFLRYAYALLPPPVLISPPDNVLNQQTAPLLRWHPVRGAIGYTLQLSTDSLCRTGFIVDDSTLNDTANHVAGLSPSTEYYWRVRASDTSGAGPFSPIWKFTTVPPLPVRPHLIVPLNETVLDPDSILFRWDSILTATAYRFQESADSSFTAFIIDDTVVPAPRFIQIHSTKGTHYWWRVRASNFSGFSSWSDTGNFFTSQISTVSFSTAPGWNLTSLPFLPADPFLHAIFPLAVGSAYSYDGAGYRAGDTLRTSVGYWMRLNAAAQVVFHGTDRTSDTIPVNAGWNLIGDLSVPFPASAAVTMPPGVLSSRFFGYANAYYPADTLMPGKGYWINSDSAGFLILAGTSPASGITRDIREELRRYDLRIADRSGREAVLQFARSDGGRGISLPPVPPAGCFDVRYSDGTALARPNRAGPNRVAVRIATTEYPVVISWNGYDEIFSAGITIGNRRYPLRSPGTVVVSEGTAVSISFLEEDVVPSAYQLRQNYPNPWNPETVIEYGLPSAVHVRLEIINMLGEEVRMLVDQEQSAGFHSVTLDGASMSSGVYLFKITAGSYSEVKKMILMR